VGPADSRGGSDRPRVIFYCQNMILQATRAGAGEERCLVAFFLGVGRGLEVGKADYFFQKLRGNVVLGKVSTTSTANVSGGIGD